MRHTRELLLLALLVLLASPPVDSGSARSTCMGGDGDGDGVLDSCDNCPAIWNPAQRDIDFGPLQIISWSEGRVYSVVALDVDGDGDSDVISGSRAGDSIRWYENTGASQLFGAGTVIYSGGFGGAPHLVPADLDGDGDDDLLACTVELNPADPKSTPIALSWFRNDSGVFGPRMEIDRSLSQYIPVAAGRPERTRVASQIASPPTPRSPCRARCRSGFQARRSRGRSPAVPVENSRRGASARVASRPLRRRRHRCARPAASRSCGPRR